MQSRDHGSGTIYAAIAVVMMTAFALAVLTFSAAAAAHHRAASAADLAALAAAQSLQRGGDGCAEAARIATRNGAALTGCRISGEDVTVEVSVDGPTAFGRRWTLDAAARAGPASEVDGGRWPLRVGDREGPQPER